MIITLAIVILMVAVIISDKLPFGAPALLACALLVVTNQADIATAFSGFTDKNVIMIMGFLAAMCALQKTELIYNLKKTLGNVAKKGGIKGFILLIFTIMAIANIMSGTSLYILVITLISTIPYNKELPTSRILLPAACACNSSGWLPNGVAMFAGIIASLCEKSGYPGASIDFGKFIMINMIWSVIYLIYSVLMHKVLPDKDISDSAESGEVSDVEKPFVATLTDGQQKLVYVCYVVLLASMVFLQKLPGEIGYAIPMIVAGIFLAAGAINFKEMITNMFSPVVIMMAGVIGVAAAMSNCGLSAVLGDAIANVLGANPSLFVLVLVFAVMTSIMATFTGASFGSLFIFAPIGIALCMKYGYSPIPLVFACTKAAWINYIMPIDGMPALVMGVGKYKLTEFWAYTLPQWVIQMLVVSGLATVFFA